MSWKTVEERRTYARKYYASNKDKIRTLHRKHADKYRKAEFRRFNVTKYLLYSARRRAKAKGLPFDIELCDLTIPLACPLLGMPLLSNHGGKKHAPNSPTVDRIIPELGYVKGNVRVVSFLGNVMKRNATPEQLRIFALSILPEQGFLRLDY